MVADDLELQKRETITSSKNKLDTESRTGTRRQICSTTLEPQHETGYRVMYKVHGITDRDHELLLVIAGP